MPEAKPVTVTFTDDDLPDGVVVSDLADLGLPVKEGKVSVKVAATDHTAEAAQSLVDLAVSHIPPPEPDDPTEHLGEPVPGRPGLFYPVKGEDA